MYDIIFFVPYMGFGGSERVMINIANNKVYDDKKVLVCILKKGGEMEPFLDNNVDIVYLNSPKVSHSLLKVISILLKYESKNVFSSLWHMNIILSIAKIFTNSKAQFIARETNIVSEKIRGYFNRLALAFAYNRFDIIIAQSQDMKTDLINNFNIKREKIEVINNGVDLSTVKYSDFKRKPPIEYDLNDFNVVSVGKLEAQKGYIEFLKKLASSKLPNNFKFFIIGDGALKKDISELIVDLSLQDKVVLLGKKKNPYLYVYHAKVFISSSLYEGYPNAVIESLVLGTPVLSNNYLGGINEIINEKNGKIIDFSKMSKSQLILELEKLSSFSRSEILNDSKRFTIENMMRQYNEILRK